ncbi:MAG: radical SAM family heme chaperone HemW [Firmicutes bacterium]|nr:radical SAM family heme chaperone HemW [Bacillota bacterium]
MESAYIHIPFCDTICSYCDFCKFIRNDEWINKYLNALEKEINTKYKGEILNTIYIGGGTPSCLNLEQLIKLFSIIKVLNRNKEYEFTFECNIENITKDKLKLLYDNGVNRLSIGIQTFNEKYLTFLNRNHTKQEIIEKINLAKEIGFKNINIDLIYGLPNQTLEELNEDIEEFLKLNITHISTYSLIIEPNTKIYINNYNNIDEDIDFEMYKLICNKLKDNGYNHYEISNFSKVGYESKHNLTYWNNNEYYGFGLGASGYIDNIRYENTRSFNRYLSGEYVKESHKLDLNEIIENEFILGLRKINGINKEIFKNKYNKDIKNIEVVNKLLECNNLLEDEKNIYINPDYIYVSNDILVEFID